MGQFSNEINNTTKSRFGVVFAKQGITGATRTTDASLERLKAYQGQDIAVVVVDGEDVSKVVRGENLVAMIRAKYEEVRFDLRKKAKAPNSRARSVSTRTGRRLDSNPRTASEKTPVKPMES